MLDYKDIITKRFLFQMSGREIAEQLGASKSGWIPSDDALEGGSKHSVKNRIYK